MKKEKKRKNFIPQPDYPGGPKAITEFIYAQLKYPEEAGKLNIEGTVVLKAEINFKGEVIGTKIISSLVPACDEEASRVVKLLKFTIDKIKDLKVSYFKTFTIKFKRPAQALEMNVQYTIVKERKQNTKVATGVLNYNITLK